MLLLEGPGCCPPDSSYPQVEWINVRAHHKKYADSNHLHTQCHVCVHIHTPVDRHRRVTLLQAVRAFCSCSELNMLSSQSNSACIATRRCTTATANFMDNGFYSLTQGSPLESYLDLPCLAILRPTQLARATCSQRITFAETVCQFPPITPYYART